MRLSRFIGVCFIVVLIVWAILTSYAIYSLYSEGLDDSSHFYLWKDTQLATNYYQQHQQLPKSDSFRAYYKDIQQLPDLYVKQIKAQDLNIHKPILLVNDDESVYILPFYLPQHTELSFVLHRFTAADDEGYTVSKFSQVFWWFLLLGIPCGLLIAYVLFVAIASPISRLSAWSKDLAKDEHLKPLNKQDLKFLELQSLAQLLFQSFEQVKDSNQREKRFLQTLSHELRTPLATTQATLDVLERKTSNDEWLHQKLQRIRRANRQMQELSTALLWLWHQPNTITPLTLSTIDATDLVDDCWQQLQSQTAKTYVLHKQIYKNLHISCPLPLMQIVVYNLLKNAQQYTNQEPIMLGVDGVSLRVVNQKANTIEQGFGIGLMLVQHIAQRMNWQCVIEQNETIFSIQIIF
jgi:signal transduction histidine kinase